MAKVDHLVMPKDHMEELYNSANPLVRYVHRQRLNAIASLLPPERGLRVLDAGCGEGHLLRTMHERHSSNSYYGVDVTEVALDRAHERAPFANLQMMELSALSFKDEFFDVVTITEVLEHVIEYERVIAELKRVLKTGGTFIITFPNEILWTISRLLLGRRPIKVLDHVNSFNPEMIEDLVSLERVVQRSLPFPLPFSISLGCLLKFRK